ncbi:MAG: hypothetical protein ACJAYC_002151, partial [Halieaceae bacterium]
LFEMITFTEGIITALISALIALAVARHNSKSSDVKFRAEIDQVELRLRREFAAQTSLEIAIQALMSKGFALRSFPLIRHHIRGFKDDELRRLLISSGCICFQVIKDKEYWGLLTENETLLQNRTRMESKGIKFYDLEDDEQESPDGSNT